MKNSIESSGLVRGSDGRLRPAWAATSKMLQDYYDEEWGFPVHDEQGLFERLSLETFQAGLSWSTVLTKRPAFREAFADFDPEQVAQFEDDDVEVLLENEGIIRNRSKICAVINNAQATLELRADVGLDQLIWSFLPEQQPAESQTTCPESKAMAKALKQHGFQFVGPTTCFALMQAIGMINGRVPHDADKPERSSTAPGTLPRTKHRE
ncbi:DNA-3-methyladenine glycosylase I [Corynebacterium lizhenjunii]|uniref:DNA-3-methyladenine glycosylase I n=1 Tax=Corynebacterium lizhenjunii TaxID=2709394 RepID=A0A7T0KFF8_9CORY|nr:DNA-3-methyladenine glycosylase I [Corynebacterium lizhenjunii]QPK79806.1 DNA-3-methyladenine glycosylase I [Corynebacterium lizhenjunii]